MPTSPSRIACTLFHTPPSPSPIQQCRENQASESPLFWASWKQAVDQPAQPNAADYASLLRSCAKAKDLSDGKRIHAHMITTGVQQYLLLGNLLFQMYDKCGAHEEALLVFANMHERHVFSWNTLIKSYAQQGQIEEALRCFDEMQQEGMMPNRVTFICLLSVCASEAVLREGCRIHARLADSGVEFNVVGGTALVNMYSKCGTLQDAKKVFDRMHHRDVVLWNSMIAAYAELEHGNEALQLFDDMQQEGVMPDQITFIAMLVACASQARLAQGKWTHARMVKCSYAADIIAETALVNMYGKCGSLEGALRIFDNMCRRNVVSWTSMIAVLAQHKQSERASRLFDQMQWEGVIPNKVTYVNVLLACATKGSLLEGKHLHVRIIGTGFTSDVVVGNALINMYGKCGSLEAAQRVFNTMHQRDIITWNGMITVYLENGQDEEAFKFFEKMQRESVTPDRVTLISILAGCANRAALAEGEQLHAYILTRNLGSDAFVCNSLINMYGKCGSLENAQRVFDKMTKPNVVSWTALIAAYAQHGWGKKALHLFNQMQREGALPNKVTFVSILAACSHAGLIDEGQHFFASMVRDHGISPDVDHYVCIVDLLGRAGRLDEAECFINKMPFQHNPAVFVALLGACRYQTDLDRGERAAQRVFEIDPENSAPYLMLSKLYASAGRGDDAADVLIRMWSKGLKGQPEFMIYASVTGEMML